MGPFARLQQTGRRELIIDSMARFVIRSIAVLFAMALLALVSSIDANAATPTTATTATAPAIAVATSNAAATPAARPTTLPASFDLNLPALPRGEQAVLAIVVEVPAGYHAQSNTPTKDNYIPFKVTMEPNAAIEFGDPIYPHGENKTYPPPLGALNVYEGRVVTYVPLRVKSDAPLGPVTINGKLQYQICDDKVCLFPRRPTFKVETNIAPAGTKFEPNKPELFAGYSPPATQATLSAGAAPATASTAVASTPPPRVFAEKKNEWTMLTWFGAALLAGLLFNVMPCVLPVLPLKAAAFHRAAEHHRGKSIALGLAFSFGIVAVFGVLAVLVLVLRVVQWGDLFRYGWFVWSLVALLTLCALGMFGVFAVELPTALYAVDPRKDTIGGNMVFGAFTAILATPCTAPLLPGLLLWASSQPVYIGVPAMLLVGVGMAIPYFILSATPELAKQFPRSGPWPELFKQMMGFMLLAVAIYFAGGRLIHGPEFWWLVVAVIAIASLYLVARTVQLSPNARPLGISATIAVILFGGALAWTARITGLTAPIATVAGASFLPYSDEQFQSLRSSGKPVLVKFTANWCTTCQVIEGTVFRDASVWNAIKQRDVAALKVDLTDEEAPGKDLLLKLNPAGGIPLTAIFVPGRDEPIVLASIYSSAELLAALDQVNGPAHASAR